MNMMTPAQTVAALPFCQNEAAYRVGALLYTPATRTDVVQKIRENGIVSIALCLEDSIRDAALPEAEAILKNTLHEIRQQEWEYQPGVWVRVRSPEHFLHVYEMLGEENDALMGYILPKFDSTNAQVYKAVLLQINEKRMQPLFVMPVLESARVARIETRKEELYRIKAVLDTIHDRVLNVRVGGNDFCNLFGVRRNANQTIYDIGVVRDILVDILNVFSTEYVLSGPVWEYFGKNGSADFAKGLKKELVLDRLNGFIGKTAIHPSQLPIIHQSLKVTRSDYEDALQILQWTEQTLGVQSSEDGSRMNEVKCHHNWAQKIWLLGKIYGVKENACEDLV